MSAAEKDTGSNEAREWERGWEEHERLQLRRLSALPLTDKLAWLEEARRIVMRLTKTRENIQGRSVRTARPKIRNTQCTAENAVNPCNRK